MIEVIGLSTGHRAPKGPRQPVVPGPARPELGAPRRRQRDAASQRRRRSARGLFVCRWRAGCRRAAATLPPIRRWRRPACPSCRESPRFRPAGDCRAVLAFYARLRGLPAARIETVIGRWGWASTLDVVTGRLSGGTRQRLGLAILDLPDAPILMLDEPGLSLDPDWRRALQQRLRAQASEGRTILVADPPARRMGGTGRPLSCARGRAGRSAGPIGRLREAFRRAAAGPRSSVCAEGERSMTTAARAAFAASCQREFAANRVDRFLHAHLALAAAAGFLPLFHTRRRVGRGSIVGAARSVVLPVALVTAAGAELRHAEADEFPLLFAQPAPRWVWLLGKAAAVTAVLGTASLCF